jgi:hypothetical protein
MLELLIFTAAMLAAMLTGMALRSRLPEHHTSSRSEEAVLRSVGLVVTMAALVLGFVVSSAQSYYQAVQSDLTDIAADVSRLDAVLERIGPQADGPRRLLRKALGSAVHTVWPDYRSSLPNDGPGNGLRATGQVADAILALPPGDARAAALQQQAVGLATGIEADAYRLARLQQGRSQTALLAVILSWLVIVYLGFGLVSPGTPTATVALVASAAAAAGALFLVVELSTPLSGLVHIDPSVLAGALSPALSP